jgi:hypothetical protein
MSVDNDHRDELLPTSGTDTWAFVMTHFYSQLLAGEKILSSLVLYGKCGHRSRT